MLKKLILLIILAGLVYLNVTTPKQADHEELLMQKLQQLGPVPESLQTQIFAELDFSNFLVCSAVKTTTDSKMISLGYLDRVKLVHTDWPQQIRKKFARNSDY